MNKEEPQFKMFVVLAPSGRGFRNCLLGSGPTASAAWSDAFGPVCRGKKPKHAGSAFIQTITDPDEFRDMIENTQD